MARKGESTLTQVAKDFGISEACLHRWLKAADVEDGVRPGVTTAESAELRELKKRNRVLEMAGRQQSSCSASPPPPAAAAASPATSVGGRREQAVGERPGKGFPEATNRGIQQPDG